MLQEKDLKQIAQRGISEEQIKTQLHQFDELFSLFISCFSHIDNGLLR